MNHAVRLSATRVIELVGFGWLPEPIRSLAVVEIERLRFALGGKARDRRHLGEAATIVVAEAQGYTVAVDDRDATHLAQARGLGTTSTVAILRDCVHAGLLTGSEAHDLLYAMIDDHDRRLAEGLIRLTPGVRDVRNEIQVPGGPAVPTGP